MKPCRRFGSGNTDAVCVVCCTAVVLLQGFVSNADYCGKKTQLVLFINGRAGEERVCLVCGVVCALCSVVCFVTAGMMLLCCVSPCCAVLCCTVLCCAVLCCSVMCCAVYDVL
jgi:hypothetical protein